MTDQQAFLAQWRTALAPYALGYRIRHASQLLSRRFQDRLAPFGLTPFHWVVLCCLWVEDGLPTSIICARLDQVGGTLTGVLDRMEERGFVVRARDPQDRRIWRIWLTEEGRSLKELLLPVAEANLKVAVQDFTPAETALVSRVLDQMIANLR